MAKKAIQKLEAQSGKKKTRPVQKKRKLSLDAGKDGGKGGSLPSAEVPATRGRHSVFLHQTEMDWTPTGVLALAASRDGRFVAAARESGAIELYETSEAFPALSLVKVIPGREGACISSLVWVGSEEGGASRLLSGGLDGFIVEWDFQTLDAKTVEASHGGGVWGLAMQESEGGDQLVAAACDDGSIRVFGVEKEGGFFFKGSMISDSERCLCVAWEMSGSRLVSGHSDGCIRVWDTDVTSKAAGGFAGREAQKIVLPRSVKKKQEAPTKDKRKTFKSSTVEEKFGSVWCLLFLKKDIIVSGDSDGRVLFWDARFGSLLFEFHKHEADVMALAVTPNGKALFASGVDVKVAMFQDVGDTGGVSKWVYCQAKRPHTHDVRALLVFRHEKLECLLIGGQNGHIQQVSASRAMIDKAFLQGRMSPVLAAPDARKYQVLDVEGREASRVLLSYGHRTVDLFGLHRDPDESFRSKADQEVVACHRNAKHLARVELEGACHLTCCRMSPDGKFLAASTQKQLKLMAVEGLPCGESLTAASANVWGSSRSQLSIAPIGLPRIKAAVCLAFSNSGEESFLYAAHMDNSVSVLNLGTRKIVAKLNTEPPSSSSERSQASELSPINDSISSISVSYGGKLLACTLYNRIHLIDLKSCKRFATIHSERQIACTAFTSMEANLAVVGVDKTLSVYDAQTGCATEWSKKQPTILKLSKASGQVLGAAFMPKTMDRMVVYTEKSACFICFKIPSPGTAMDPGLPADGIQTPAEPDGELPLALPPKPQAAKLSAKRRKVGKEVDNWPGANARIVRCENSYSILHLDFMGSGAAMLVRADWRKVLDSLPPPVYRKRYGVS